nr:transglutaminase domain-containing protein [Colwellia maritima]
MLGIPSRIVTGYLGGEYNNASSSQNTNSENTQQGGHLSIYQYDAHAWSEIWLEDIGRQRVDPTAAVDPQRVESGWSTELLSQQSALSSDLFGLYKFRKTAWLNTIRLQFDALDYQWTRWVLGYSNEQQYDLLKRLFGGNIQWKATAIVVATLIAIMTIFTLFYRFDINAFKRKKLPLWLNLYQQALAQLAKKGTKKTTDMSPSDFAQVVAQQHPEIATQFREFSTTFEILMFKNLNSKQQVMYLTRLKQQFNRLKPN